jgi:hypothetical protein
VPNDNWTPGDRRRTGLAIIVACAIAAAVLIIAMVGTFKPLWDNATRAPVHPVWVEPTPTAMPWPYPKNTPS